MCGHQHISTVDCGPREEHAPVAYLFCVSPTSSYISTTMHKIQPLKSDRNVRIVGSEKGYFYTINLGKKV